MKATTLELLLICAHKEYQMGSMILRAIFGA